MPPTPEPAAPAAPSVELPAQPAQPAAPPAAVIVNHGERTEREIVLERELQTEKLARKKAETDAGYAQDEARRLKELQAMANAPKPKNKNGTGWTLLHDPEV
jgi:hypothetical protein